MHGQTTLPSFPALPLRALRPKAEDYGPWGRLPSVPRGYSHAAPTAIQPAKCATDPRRDGD